MKLEIALAIPASNRNSYFFILRPNIYKSWFLYTHFIPNISDLID